jgi:hypothetical protein
MVGAAQLLCARGTNIFAVENGYVVHAFAENAGWLVLFKQNVIAVNIDLNRIFGLEPQDAPQLDGQNDPAERIERPDNTCRFHEHNPPIKIIIYV